MSEYTEIMVIWHISGLQAAYQFIDFQSKYCVFIPDKTLLLRLNKKSIKPIFISLGVLLGIPKCVLSIVIKIKIVTR